MNTFSINGVTCEIIVSDEMMQEVGVPYGYPAAMLDYAHKGVIGNTDGLIVVPSVFAELPEEVQFCMKVHEAGHAALKHLEKCVGAENELVIDAKIEAEADAWAARTIGVERFEAGMIGYMEFCMTRYGIESDSTQGIMGIEEWKLRMKEMRKDLGIVS